MEIRNGMPAHQITGAQWRKSSRSVTGECVEIAVLRTSSVVAVRDSRDAAGPALIFTNEEFRAFLRGVRDGEFDSG